MKLLSIMGTGRTEITFIFVAVVIFFVLRYFYKLGKQVEKKEKIAKQQKIEKERTLKIPSVCPHCKNPNTKKLRICEWCGNEIY